MAYGVANVFEGFGEGLEFGWEDALVVAGVFELPRIATGEQGGSRRGAFGVGRVGIVEEQAFSRYSIEIRSLDPIASVSACVAERPVVSDSEENIGRATRLDHTWVF